MKTRTYYINSVVILIFIGFMPSAKAQDTIIKLWPELIPNQLKTTEKEVREETDILRFSNVQEPTIEVYLPAKANANSMAMLIFPGGGYHILAYDWEGTDMAKLLNTKGIAGIVVKYRLPDSKSLKDQFKVPLQDAQRAIRLVRANAGNFNIDAQRVGIMGFSAGGHLASTLGTHFNEEVYSKQDTIDAISARPDFMALIYPVISMQEGITHQGSRNNLLGQQPAKEQIQHFSNELQVTKDTPPTFLVHAQDDKVVPVENSLLFFKALQDKGVPASMHLYPKGGHGFSLALKNDYLSGWTDQLIRWIQSLDM